MDLNEVDLDNPVWNALTEMHSEYGIDYGHVKFYKTDFTPFGAFINNQDATKAIEAHSKLIKEFFIVGKKPKLPEHFRPLIKYVGLQMIVYSRIDYPITQTIIQLNKSHYKDLMTLVKLVYPHFFKANTNALGRYFGIYKNNELVAITGERMQTQHFTEISGVITHPDHLGNGYAKQLVAYTANKIFDSGKTPFLHVDQNNIGPIALYEKLGFVVRRKLHFWKISC
jgi:ribosomal protein S18 acetylase RimI-like enzyme